MAYGSYPNFLVKILQAIDLDFLEVVDGFARRHRTGDGRVIGDLARHRLASDRTRLADRLLAFGGVHDEADLVVLDHVDDVRPSLAHLVRAPTLDAGRFERGSRAMGRD